MGGFAPPDIPRDVGEFEELAASMAPAERAYDRVGIRLAAIEVVLAPIGIGLQDALPSGEVPVGVGHLPVTREVEQGSRRRPAREGPIVPDMGPGRRPARSSFARSGTVVSSPCGRSASRI